MKRWYRGLAICLAICMAFSSWPTLAYAAESNADLASISVSSGTLSPAFEADVTDYDLVLPTDNGDVTITVVKADTEAVVTINGSIQDNIVLDLNSGEAVDAVIEVTGQDGTTTKTYTVHVSRPDTANADLAAINTSAGTVTPGFDTSITEYDLLLPYDTSETTLSVVKADEDAYVEINEVPSEDVTLEVNPGETQDAVIVVTAQDGIATKTYTVHVTRETIANADLAAINISAGTLLPVFSPDVTDYNLVLEENIVGVAITPVEADEMATIKINGSVLDSLTLMLNSGETKDTVIEVTAGDNITKKTYTVHVTRSLPSSEAKLASITLTDGYLYPQFNSATLSYKGLVNATQESITLKAVLLDAEGQVEIDGTIGAEKVISVGVGETKQVEIKTTSRDKTATKTYTVSLYRQRSGESLAIESSFFTPNEVIASTDSNTLYLRDNAGKRIFAADIDAGVIRSVTVQYAPYKIMYMGGLLLVTLANPQANMDCVAVVDPDTFTIIRTLDVNMDLKGAFADNDYIYAYGSSSTYAYSRSTGEKVAANSYGGFIDVKLNPVTGYYYGTTSAFTYSFRIVNGLMEDIRKTSTYKGGSLCIMPDGQHVVLNGVILTCSSDSAKDLQYTGKLVTNSKFTVDSRYDELYVSYDRLIYVYDAVDFEIKRVVPETKAPEYLIYSKDQLFYVKKDTSNTLIFNAINTGCTLESLKINGEPFSEFYPLQTTINKGEVSNNISSVEITAEPAQEGAIVSGDIGTMPLEVGVNTVDITVTYINGRSEHYSLKITRRESDPPTSLDGRTKLGFAPLDIAFDPDMPVAYLTAKDGYSLYRVDLETGEITEKKFDLKAERITVKNGKIYVTLLRSGHDYWDGSYGEGYGAFAVVDAASFLTERIFNTNIDPYDIEVDSQGYVYLAPGSNQWSYVASYDGDNGAYVSGSGSIYYESSLFMNPQTGKLYSTDSSTAFEITDGVFTGQYSSSSGGFSSGTRMSTDGQYFFDCDGEIYTSTLAKTGDMLYSGKINKLFTSVCFDLESNEFFTAKDKMLTVYDYDTRKEKYSYTSADDFINIEHNGSRIIALQKKSNGDYYLNYLDDSILGGISLNETGLQGFDPKTQEYSLTLISDEESLDIDATAFMDRSIVSGDTGTVPLNIGENTYSITVTGVQSGEVRAYTLHVTRLPVGNANLSAINCTSGTMTPSFSADTLEYEILLDKDTSSATITPVLSDSSASVKIDGAAAESKTVSLKVGQQQDISIAVTAADGYTVKTYIVHVKRAAGNQNLELPAGFTPYDKKISPDGKAMFMTCKNQSTVYKADFATGKVTELALPGIAKKLGFAGEELLVTLSMPEYNEYFIGIIDPDTFTLTDQFKVQAEYTGLTGDASYYYFYTSSSIFVYSQDTREKLSTTNLYSLTDLKINPKSGYLYACASGAIKSYGVVNGQLQAIKNNGNYSANSIAILPDGRHLILNDGTILMCSTNTELDLQYTGKVTCNGVFSVDAGANELYIADDRLINVYNATDFNFKRIIPETSTVNTINCAGGKLIIGQANAQIYHTVYSGTLLKTLKINGEPFSEFYPTHNILDRGEVPNAMQSVEITAEAAKTGVTVSGTGTHALSVGENVIAITVSDSSTDETQTYYLIFNRKGSDPAPVAYDARVKLPFTPMDIVLDPDRPVEYMTAVDGKSLYRVNYETGEVTEKKFDLTAERITINNGKVYVALLRAPHNSYADGEGYGAVAVIDTTTFNIDTIININIDPYDIEADAQGRVYLAPGSGQWSIMAVYDSSNGRKICLWQMVDHRSFSEFNTQYNKIYLVDSTSSPRDIEAYEVTDGVITKNYDSPYHGDYSMSTYIKISPDGKYIFNGSGNVFKCAPAQTGDMVYDGTLNNAYTAICFNLADNVFYIANNKTLTAYNYDSRTIRYKVILADSIINLQHNGTHITAVLKNSNGDYSIGYLGQYEENADLSGISSTAGILSPDFSKDTVDYTLTYNASSVTITPVKSVEGQTLIINGETVSSKTLSLAIGETVDLSVEVTAADGTTKKVYTVHIKRAYSTNANLTKITSSSGTLSPSFDKNMLSYTVNLTASQSSTSITPVKEDSKAIMRINGQVSTSNTVSLSTGTSKDLTIEVTAEDGITKKTYSVHVVRASLNSADLSGMTTSSGTLSPTFSSNVYIYNIALANTVGGTTIYATKSDGAATVWIDGEKIASKYISLAPGTSKDVLVDVIAQDGVTKKTYTVHVSRSVSNNAALSGISVSVGSLSPGFNSGTYAYTIDLPSNISNVTLNTTKADGTATVLIDGNTASDKTVYIQNGESKDVTILVTAQDGSTKKTYVVHVTREAVRATGVSLDRNVLELEAGDMITLSANVFPSNTTFPAVSWSTSDASVATVDQTGKVTAVSTGSATITATADGISTTCSITVQPAQYAISAIANSPSYGTVSGSGNYSNGVMITLTATPKAGYRFVRWLDGVSLVSSSVTYSLTANADRSITAEFAPIGTPTLYAGSAGYDSTRLTWTAVECAAGYEVWRSASAWGTYSKIGTVTGTSYTDNSLLFNTPYYYKVNAYCEASTATTYGTQSAYASATPVPAAPAVYASPTSYNSAYVSWNAVPGASGYELSRSTAPNSSYSIVKTMSSLSYTNSSLGTGTTYYYRVRAYRTVGRAKVWGDYSTIASAQPVLSSIASASAEAFYPTSVKVSWSAVTGKSGYEIWRSTSLDSGFALLKSTGSTSYKDTTCTPFVTYYYQIRAYRTVSGHKVYSASASPTANATPILGNVSGVKAAVSSPSSVKLSWSSVTGASGYEVLRSTTIDGGYVSIKSTSGRSFTDNNLVPNTTYYYQVRAYRKVGSGIVPSAPSAPVSATPYFASVTNAKAVSGGVTKIKLTWSAVSGRTGYEIYRGTSPGDFVFLKSTTSTSLTDSGLMTGVTYYYKIVAFRTVNGIKYRSSESVVSATP